ncbi:hypothetical protein I862_02045 [endosymbiont of Acanthamoeba sp. UWC8]|uniref:C45 family autoproteolytic acyltransferase/hydolase n=1 Tax=endosymbiont of Acanthamoeba sp. UWC8 TaxID=86106 RepID=UPI0004D17254|nr:C45 family autoproteolytic acyltransferase/hydolase [endosymbiont of Acanthamoeba sp. UWC8]AIF80972.1 hypothetical protein I862_02045 [endosymbiont of Acanthamoeba sp. UWC8]
MPIKHLSLYERINNINLLVLTGTRKKMGTDYGYFLKEDLLKTLNILTDYYGQQGISYERLADKAEIFYQRYPTDYKSFIEGMAEGSGISLSDCKILLGMETLNSLLREKSSEISACAFLFSPTSNELNAGLIGRNYDFFKPFDECAKYLTLTVLYEDNKLPTAFISMPGQIYCPTCINSEGIFAEFNNGMPSGGFAVDTSKETLLATLLKAVQSSRNLSEFKDEMYSLEADYSLIINAASHNETHSYEFSPLLGMRPYYPILNQPYGSTNFFHNDTWGDIPAPTDESTWLGVSRRDNLVNFLHDKGGCDIECFKDLMDKSMDKGGSVWDYTIYQIIYDSFNKNIYLKINSDNPNWTEIPLEKYFSLAMYNTTNEYNAELLLESYI